MKLVVIESPYAGDVERNRRYLNRCIRDCIDRGESPYASHKMLVDSLDDNIPAERAIGIDVGLAWSIAADEVAIYIDYGVSDGMNKAIAYHNSLGHEVVYRKIGSNPK